MLKFKIFLSFFYSFFKTQINLSTRVPVTHMLHWSIVVIVVWSSSDAITSVRARPSFPCPTGCECEVDNVQPFGDLLSVTCRKMEVVPDLSVLRETKMGKELHFQQNSLSNISQDDFPAGLNITILNLSRNKGVSIADTSFINLGISLKILKLEAIDMPFNGTLSMLDPLFSLQELSLSYNNKYPYVKGAAQEIDYPLFQGEITKSLKKLTLAFCGIRTLEERSLNNLEKLEELDVSNNWFTSVPEVIKHLHGLTFLELFYCKIESVKDGDFSGLSRLKALDLSSNQNLQKIESRGFGGAETSLEKLIMSRCNLSEVPVVALKGMKQLKHLDISENVYKTIPAGALDGDFKLTHLAFGAKGLQFNPDMFKGQEINILEVGMERMSLTSIPLEPLKKLEQLKILNLAYNNLTVLPERAFEGIKANRMYLSNNPISEIDPLAFKGLPPRLVINLRNTKLDDFEFLLGYKPSEIEAVDFGNDAFVCRCDMKSALNATLNIYVYGSCTVGQKGYSISSPDMESIIEQACDLERSKGNIGCRSIDRAIDIKMMSILVIGITWIVDRLSCSSSKS